MTTIIPEPDVHNVWRTATPGAAVGIVLVSLHLDAGNRSARFVGPGVPLSIVACFAWGVVTVGTTVLVREAPVLEVILVSRIASVALVLSAVGWREARSRGAPAPEDDRGLVSAQPPSGRSAISRDFPQLFPQAKQPLTVYFKKIFHNTPQFPQA